MEKKSEAGLRYRIGVLEKQTKELERALNEARAAAKLPAIQLTKPAAIAR